MSSSTLQVPLIWPSQVLPPLRLDLPFRLSIRAAHTLFLFTKSDLKTILLPVTVFAFLSAPCTNLAQLPYTVGWIWLNLLQFCVSNQSINPEEDASNKPWRPIPSNRITAPSARLLRWTLLPLCLLLSFDLGAFTACFVLAVATILHNEFDLGSHWVLRNVCNSVGYAAFNAGATAVACSLPNYRCDLRTLTSFVCNALIIFTTIYAQDFRDEEGDRLMGRQTVPLVWPESSRVAIFVSLVAWSVGLSAVCELNAIFATVFSSLGLWIGLHFYLQRSPQADRRSYLYYNLWLAMAQVVHIPGVARALS